MEFGLSNSQWSYDQTQVYFSSSYTHSLSKGSLPWSFPGLHRRGIYNAKWGTVAWFIPSSAIVYLNDLKQVILPPEFFHLYTTCRSAEEICCIKVRNCYGYVLMKLLVCHQLLVFYSMFTLPLHFTATFSVSSVVRPGRTWLWRWVIWSSRIQKLYQLCQIILIIPVSAFWERKLLF